MTSQDFVYWLQGFMELADPEVLSAKQLDMIKSHLALVFIHDIDPKAGGPATQDKLNKVHSGTNGVVFRC